jgi:hypothetical protein
MEDEEAAVFDSLALGSVSLDTDNVLNARLGLREPAPKTAGASLFEDA